MGFVEDVSGKPDYQIDCIISLLKGFGYHPIRKVTGAWVNKNRSGTKRVEEELIIY